MTLARILRMLGRQWLVLIIGLALTAAGAAASLHVTGIFTARTTITLLPPIGWAIGGNTLSYSGATLVGFAKLVEQTVNEDDSGQLFAAPDTPLYGAGVRQGEVVYVPDAGGQWAPNLNRPSLIIDVVGPTPEYVASRVEALTAEISGAIEARQDESGVVEEDRIGWEATPGSPEATYAGPNRLRMLAGIAVLGAGVTMATALGVDVLRRRRVVRRSSGPGDH